MGKLLDLAGERYGALLVVKRSAESSTSSSARWIVRCDCGIEKVVSSNSLRKGRTVSCGAGHHRARHGHDTKSGASPTYRTWCAMLKRCHDPKATGYDRYGGRGITVCAQWRDFAVFLKDMGLRPPGMSIDRVNVNGNYEPENCRWATDKQQAANRSTNRQLLVDGCLMNLTDAAAKFGITKFLLSQRMKSGWGQERALSQPTQKAQLSREQALDILRRIRAGERRADLAAEFNVSIWMIHDIGKGKRKLA